MQNMRGDLFPELLSLYTPLKKVTLTQNYHFY